MARNWNGVSTLVSTRIRSWKINFSLLLIGVTPSFCQHAGQRDDPSTHFFLVSFFGPFFFFEHVALDEKSTFLKIYDKPEHVITNMQTVQYTGASQYKPLRWSHITFTYEGKTGQERFVFFKNYFDNILINNDVNWELSTRLFWWCNLW